MFVGYATEFVHRVNKVFVRVTDLGTTASVCVTVDALDVKHFPTDVQRSAVATVTERDNNDAQLLGSFGDALMWAVADEDWPANHERP